MILLERNIRASVLPTVLLFATWIMLGVLGIIALWEQDRNLFARLNYHRQQRAHLESALRLYEQTENLPSLLDDDASLTLYDSLPSSRVYYDVRPWGLYEAITVENHDRRLHLSRLMGSSRASEVEATFWYVDNRSILTFAGESTLQGQICSPPAGIAYGTVRSVFFSGERIPAERIASSRDELPALHPEARSRMEQLGSLRNEESEPISAFDSVTVSFCETEPTVLRADDLPLRHCMLSGQIVLCGESLAIDSTCRLQDVLLVARSVRIGHGFRGRLQIVASDSVVVEERTRLEYPSGIVVLPGNRQRHVALRPGAEVSGYVIVDGDGSTDRDEVNYRQDRTAVVRGLLWVDGMAEWHGIVSGSVFLRRAIYRSPGSSYDDLIYDATLLENPQCGYPFWAGSSWARKEVGWLQ